MEQKQSIRRWVIFTIASLLFVLSQFYRASIAVIAPQLIADTGLNTRELSLISAAFFYAFALAQIPIGIYLDRFGARCTMTFLSLVAAVGALVFARADSFDGLMAGRLLLGIGMACNLMGTLKLLTMWFSPVRFATLAALVVSIGTAGNIMATTPLVLLVQTFGWRITFTLFSGSNLLLVIIFYVVVTDGPHSSIPSKQEDLRPSLGDTLSGIGNLFHTRDYWIISLGTFCRYGIFAAFQALWAGPFLMNVMGLSAITTGNMIFLMNIGLIFGGPVCGILSDRILKTRKGVVIGGLAGLSGILLVMAFLPASVNQGVLYALFFLCGIFSSSGMVMYSHIKERVPLNKAGAAMTGINFFTMAGAAVFLQGLGAMMQHFFPVATLGAAAFQTVFIVCSVCLAATALIYVQSRETLR
ncbi:MAG: MFS transporter [Thermodesulfobacteriota bacterium]|nr:MFS transporter [Thermodesulfobacteriota bacterium]